MSNKKSGIRHQIERHIIKPVYFLVCKLVIKRKPCMEGRLIESDFNCGHVNARMTERGIELLLAKDIVDKWGGGSPSSIN